MDVFYVEIIDKKMADVRLDLVFIYFCSLMLDSKEKRCEASCFQGETLKKWENNPEG